MNGAAMRRVQQGAWLLAAVFIAAQLLRYGLDPYVLVTPALLILVGVAVERVETCTRRPLKTYLRIALASAAVALVLIVMPLLMGTGVWIGLILWAGLSVAALIWCIHYERTEPL